MEKEFLKKEDVLEFITSLKYGSVIIEPESSEVIDQLNNAAFTIEKMYKTQYLKVKKLSEPENHYQITWAHTLMSPPLLFKEDIDLLNTISRIQKAQVMEIIKINPSLHTYAKKVCRSMNLKYLSMTDGFMIDARIKLDSIYKRVQVAYLSGMNRASFDAREVNHQTLRVYASQMNNMSPGLNIKVRLQADTISIIFREDPVESATIDFEKAIENLINQVGHESALKVIEDCVKKIVGFSVFDKPAIEVVIPIWKEYGFDTEQEYIEYQKNKQRDIEEMKQENAEDPIGDLEWKDSDMEWK
jgi:hypothetical protein